MAIVHWTCFPPTKGLLVGLCYLLNGLFDGWLRSHPQGPLEWLWKKATWINVGKL